jgi:hypothetical protein
VGILVVEELANHHNGGGRAGECPTTMSGTDVGCPISAHTPRKEAKSEGIERWSSGDHKSGLGFGGGGRRREIRRRRRREVRGVGAWGLRLVFYSHGRTWAHEVRDGVRRLQTPGPVHFRKINISMIQDTQRSTKLNLGQKT